MPPGAPFNSFIPPYRIRVDEFTDLSASSTPSPSALLHLLTHTHADHIAGLQAQSFGHTVICSADAKEMLLRHEVYAERSLKEHQFRAETQRTYKHLKVDPVLGVDGRMWYTGSRDLLKPLPLHTPTKIELSNSEIVTITLFDANHCPGAVMFLIEGDRGAVLHTGDFRAEPWFCDAITHNPLLQPYLVGGGKTLEAIYLDTASVFCESEVPTKLDATNGLVEMMKMYDSATHFFINSWTWGYEDILKAVARAFRQSIHLDRYKHSVYRHISADPSLRAMATDKPWSTRFHACERFDRCEVVAERQGSKLSAAGKKLVYINPVTMNRERWTEYLHVTRAKLGRGEEVLSLLVPLARHSPLPELQAFVSLFRPRAIVPNTLVPGLKGCDLPAIKRMFSKCVLDPISPGAAPADARSRLTISLQQDDSIDTAITNLVGGADTGALAESWAHSGRLAMKAGIVRRWLGLDLPAKAVPAAAPHWKRRELSPAHSALRDDEDSDYDSGQEDERGRTMHLILAPAVGIENEPLSKFGLTSASPTTQGSSPGTRKVRKRLQSPSPSPAVRDEMTEPRPMSPALALQATTPVRRSPYDESVWFGTPTSSHGTLTPVGSPCSLEAQTPIGNIMRPSSPPIPGETMVRIPGGGIYKMRLILPASSPKSSISGVPPTRERSSTPTPPNAIVSTPIRSGPLFSRALSPSPLAIASVSEAGGSPCSPRLSAAPRSFHSPTITARGSPALPEPSLDPPGSAARLEELKCRLRRVRERLCAHDRLLRSTKCPISAEFPLHRARMERRKLILERRITALLATT